MFFLGVSVAPWFKMICRLVLATYARGLKFEIEDGCQCNQPGDGLQNQYL